jgi:hypothetical protein
VSRRNESSTSRVCGADGITDFNRLRAALGRGGSRQAGVLNGMRLCEHLERRGSTQRTRIVEFAARNHLPGFYFWREFVEVGGLISYGPNPADIHRRMASYVAKILRGAKPADLPVEQPTKFELVINLKAAKALGLTVSPSLLVRADEVIE